MSSESSAEPTLAELQDNIGDRVRRRTHSVDFVTMAPSHPGAVSDADIILNRLTITLAKRQGLLASLAGVAPKDEPQQKPSPERLHQDEDSFATDPELCVCSPSSVRSNKLIA